MNRTRLLAFAALLSGASPGMAFAQTANWVVDPAKSRLGFSGVQTGEKFQGVFKQYDAQIQFDPAHPQSGHAQVTIDLASASTGDTQRDEAMPGSDWFDVKSFPKAMFEAKSFQSRGGNDYAALGTLTLRGVSHDATLPFTLTIDGGIAHAKGRLELVRTQFGIGQGAWATGQWVALEVGVDVDLVAARSAS